jgi:hypothetical protein
MPVYSVWIIEKANVTVSGGKSLDGITQGDGSHLVGETITLNAPSYLETFVSDNDANFDDNDLSGAGAQRLSGPQTINGVTYPNGTTVEAEYRIVLKDPLTGLTYEGFGYNVTNSSPAYATVEGLTFRGAWPPVGRPLTVVQASEGPGSFGQPVLPYAAITPPCFCPGTMIATPRGMIPVERLRPGDMICTVDDGPQPLRALLSTRLTPAELRRRPELAPVRLAPGLLPGQMADRPLLVSPQHRLLAAGGLTQLLFGEAEVLMPAIALTGRPGVTRSLPAGGVTYLHLVLDRHAVVWSNGVPSESLLAGGAGSMLSPAVRAELEALWGGRLPEMTACRRVLRRWEAAPLARAA